MGDGMSSDRNVESRDWFITFIIWFAGCYIIYQVWEWAASKDYWVISFGLYVVAFFYFLALGPLKNEVSKHFDK